jgi:outer membrane lipoprotein-sorting protein
MSTLTTTRRTLLTAALLAASTGLAIADDAPVDIRPTKPVKAAPVRPPAKPTTTNQPAVDPAAPTITAAEAIKRANAYFDGAQSMIADFVQVAPDGRRSVGKLYVQRPGHMLFRYAPPDRLEIVADGRSVAIRDQKLNTQDLYFIGQTPLKFLLADHIDIARDTKVTKVSSDPTGVSIVIEDSAACGGSATITLVFDPGTFALKQWAVLDAQGLQTVVTLYNVDLATAPDPALFKIDEQQRMLNSNVRGGG